MFWYANVELIRSLDRKGWKLLSLWLLLCWYNIQLQVPSARQWKRIYRPPLSERTEGATTERKFHRSGGLQVSLLTKENEKGRAATPEPVCHMVPSHGIFTRAGRRAATTARPLTFGSPLSRSAVCLRRPFGYLIALPPPSDLGPRWRWFSQSATCRLQLRSWHVPGSYY
jgi:hypothetical protein